MDCRHPARDLRRSGSRSSDEEGRAREAGGRGEGWPARVSDREGVSEGAGAGEEGVRGGEGGEGRRERMVQPAPTHCPAADTNKGAGSRGGKQLKAATARKLGAQRARARPPAPPPRVAVQFVSAPVARRLATGCLLRLLDGYAQICVAAAASCGFGYCSSAQGRYPPTGHRTDCVTRRRLRRCSSSGCRRDGMPRERRKNAERRGEHANDAGEDGGRKTGSGRQNTTTRAEIEGKAR